MIIGNSSRLTRVPVWTALVVLANLFAGYSAAQTTAPQTTPTSSPPVTSGNPSPTPAQSSQTAQPASKPVENKEPTPVPQQNKPKDYPIDFTKPAGVSLAQPGENTPSNGDSAAKTQTAAVGTGQNDAGIGVAAGSAAGAGLSTAAVGGVIAGGVAVPAIGAAVGKVFGAPGKGAAIGAAVLGATVVGVLAVRAIRGAIRHSRAHKPATTGQTTTSSDSPAPGTGRSPPSPR